MNFISAGHNVAELGKVCIYCDRPFKDDLVNGANRTRFIHFELKC